LTVRATGSKEAASSAARRRISATNIFPKQDPPVGLILKGWAGDTYLAKTMPKISPFKFLQEVRAEGEKVTWPTRKETTVTTIMVFVMVAIASVFFLLADQVMRIAVSYVLGIGV
jgi:preprotein translocase subunit SecE